MYSRPATKVLFFLLFLISLCVYSQGQLQLHANKKLFLPGEKMWFSAYLFDQIESPVKGTYLLRVEVLDEDRQLKKELTFPITNGVASGNFLIEEAWQDSKMYLYGEVLVKGSVQKSLQDVIPFYLLSNTEEKASNSGTSVGAFQWVSESGAVVADAQNTLLFQSPLGSAQLHFYEDNKLLYTDIQSTWKGLGQLTYYHDATKDYKFVLSGPNQTPQLHTVQPTSTVGLRINNLQEGEVRIQINSEAVKKGALEFWLNGKTKISEAAINTKQQVYTIPRSTLVPGVIQVRYLNNGDPLGFNWFVNYSLQERSPVRWDVQRFGADSAAVRLLSQDKKQSFRLNATVMTRESYLLSSYRDEELMAMLSEVFDRSRLPSFNKLDSRSRRSRIDHWVRLHAKDIQAEQTEIETEELAGGLILKGRVGGQKGADVKQVLVQSRGGVFALVPVDSNRQFETTVFPLAQDTLFTTAMGADGKAVLKSNCEIWMDPVKEYRAPRDLVSLLPLLEEEKRPQIEGAFVLPDNQIALEEVEVTANAKRPVAFQIDGFNEGRLITAEDAKNYPTLGSYLRRLGYGFRVFEGRVVAMSRGVGPGKATGPVPVLTLVDGTPTDDVNDVFQTLTSQIQSITFDSMKRVYISVQLKKSRRQAKSCSLVSLKGVSPQDSFEKYLPFYNKNYLQRFGSLYWNPLLEWDDSGASVKFNLLKGEEYVLVLRGLDDKNKVIDEHIPISLGAF